MTIRTGFFNSIEGDRRYDAKRFAEYFSTFIGNGVFPNPSTGMQVTQNNDMSVLINPGSAWINGYFIVNDSDFTIKIDPADGVLSRIDRVVLRYDEVERDILITVKKGEFASNPKAKQLQRDEDAFEIALADILINKGAIVITQADITDLRLNSELCGIVHGLVEQVDTTAIFDQFESWYSQTKNAYDADMATWTEEKKKAFDDWYLKNTTAFEAQWEDWYGTNTVAWENEFEEWFNTIKDILDETAEGKILGLIDENTKDIEQLKTDLSNVKMYEYKTYEELKELKENKKLKTGQSYVLTDYTTTYIQPLTNAYKSKSYEVLVLAASSSDTFNPIVFSPKYPQDIIWYDFDNNKCEDSTSPRPGFIVRRYDTKTGNNCLQDWRTMTWARWEPDANQYYKNGVLTDYSKWTSGNAVMGVIYKAEDHLLVAKNTNVPSSNLDTNVFDFVYQDITIGRLMADKTQIVSQTSDKLELKKGNLQQRMTFGKDCINNTIGECSNMLHNNVFGDYFQHNSFGNHCHSNSFGNGCVNNSFGNDCHDNSIGNNCQYNSFGNYCYSNSFGNYCYSNSFGNGCYTNSFGNSCSSNSFGSNCSSNSFGNSCYSNSFGNGCVNNSFGNYCNNNIFGNYCKDNSFGNYFQHNSFGSNCYSNSFGNSCTSNSFGSNCSSNSFDNSCYSNSFGNSCYTNSFGNNCYTNSFGNSCYSNSFGNSCYTNSFGNSCSSNVFDKYCNYLVVKLLRSKNLTSLDIYNKNYTINIEQNNNEQYVYWYLDNNNQPVYTLIP